MLIDNGKLCAFENGGAVLFEVLLLRRLLRDRGLRFIAREKAEEIEGPGHRETSTRAFGKRRHAAR